MENPGFEQQPRQAAAGAEDAGTSQLEPPFYKTRAGIVVIAVVCLAAIGGVVGLVTSGGSGGGSLGTKLQGQWYCHLTDDPLGRSTGSSTDADFSLTIGNGVYTMRKSGDTSATGSQQGTWKKDGGTLTLGTTGNPQQTILTGIPNDFGSFHIVTANGGDPEAGNVDISGTTSQSTIRIAFAITGATGSDASQNGPLMNVDCTRGSAATTPGRPVG